MNLTVRVASRLDLAALVTISEELHRLHFEARPDQFKAFDSTAVERWNVELLENPASTIWVAEHDDAVIGAVVVNRMELIEGPFCPARAWWMIDQLSVLSAYHRRGAGRALVQRVIDEARAQGVAQLELNSWSFNRSAHAAFERLGFAPKFVRFELRRE